MTETITMTEHREKVREWAAAAMAEHLRADAQSARIAALEAQVAELVALTKAALENMPAWNDVNGAEFDRRCSVCGEYESVGKSSGHAADCEYVKWFDQARAAIEKCEVKG